MLLSSRSKSTNTKTNINDLPETLLIEILRRLGYHGLVAQCRFVCKRWWKLTLEPYFVLRCLCFRLDSCDGTLTLPMIQTLINPKSEQIDTWPSLSSNSFHWFPSSPLLNPIHTKLMNFYSFEQEPIVVATYNDLILCCATRYYQHDYFICNPHTMDWVALPPPSTVLYDVPVGFICDSHFINYQGNGKDYDLSINADYKCRVVRLLPLVDTSYKWGFKKAMDTSATFKVEIFSFETGEWRESTITSPREFNFNQINSNISFACNGMLYWPSKTSTANFIMGLDPFMIGDNYKCSFIELMHNPNIKPIQCLSVLGGYLRMCSFDSSDECILVWHSEEEDDLNTAADGGARTLHVRDAVSYDYRYPLGSVDIVELIAFDPYDFDILYARGIHPRDGNDLVENTDVLIQLNFRTGEIAFFKMTGNESQKNYCFFRLNAGPWWATPIPKLPFGADTSLAQNSCPSIDC